MATEKISMNSCLRCPVTSLCFAGSYLLCGEGSYIRVYNIHTQTLVKSQHVFPNVRIHRIKILRSNKLDGVHTQYLLLLLAGRVGSIMTFSTLKRERNARSVECSFNFEPTKVQHFQDWILDGHLQETTQILCHVPSNVVLLSAHNAIYNWNTSSNIVSKLRQCSEQCILYSGYLFHSIEDELICAAGTVFNQILLWKPLSKCQTNNENDHMMQNVWKRLYGHEGVIFGLTSNETKDTLLSVSDDRSIRVWDIASESCLRVLYGHTARVWKALFLNDVIVSVGEDAYCFLWDGQGSVIKKFKGHLGKSIWSLSVSEELCTIATGGGDGSVRLWQARPQIGHLEEFTLTTTPSSQRSSELRKDQTAKEDKPRTIGFLSEKEIIVVTDQGCLQVHIVRESSENWSDNSVNVLIDQTFGSYCTMAIERKARFLVMGNLFGMIKCVTLGVGKDLKRNILSYQPFSGKVFSVFIEPLCPEHDPVWEDSFRIVASGPDGMISSVIFDVTNLSVTEQAVCQLPFSRQRWVTSISVLCSQCLSNDFPKFHQIRESQKSSGSLHFNSMVCGDRRGSVHIFSLSSKGTQGPRQSFIGLHGKTGVTSLVKTGNVLYSTGRDGAYQKIRFCPNGSCQLLERKKACKGMDWIEGLYLTSNDILIFGFYMQAYFGLWSVQRNELIFKIQCGGGYRSWDALFENKEKDKFLSFAYLKGPDINISKTPLNIEDSNVILQESLHGREITCVALLRDKVFLGSLRELFITGSEDTSIKFHLYFRDTNSCRCIHSLEGHIGGVKALSVLQLPNESLRNTESTRCTSPLSDCSMQSSYLFFSCGSRTSLKCWMLSVKHDNKQESDERTCITEQQDFEIRIESCLLAEIGSSSDILKRKQRFDLISDLDDLRFLSMDVLYVHDIISDCAKIYPRIIIATACSDGFVRLYGFDYRTKKFELLLANSFHSRCVLSVQLLLLRSPSSQARHVLLASAGTDGRIAIWDISKAMKSVYSLCTDASMPERAKATQGDVCMIDLESDTEENNSIDSLETRISRLKENFTSGSALNACNPLYTMIEPPQLVLQAHQSGINEITLKVSDDSTIQVLSGGDDNSIHLAMIRMSFDAQDLLSLSLVDTAMNKTAHISSVTGVNWLSSGLFCSCSIDQRIRLWKLSKPKVSESGAKEKGESDNPSMVLQKYSKTDVADVSSIACFDDGSTVTVLICGVGLEILSFDKEDVT